MNFENVYMIWMGLLGKFVLNGKGECSGKVK